MIINIPDIYMYHMGTFNFDGAKKFDSANNYRTRSMLVVPMLNQDNEVVGVMQLINKNTSSNYIPFTQDDIDITKTYANLSATAITKNRLIDELEELIISFLESISYAIGVKSPYGHGHISRVKELMSAIINEINQDERFFAKKRYSQAEIKEIELAAWMHDIGKIATPEHILDKSSRLEFLSDKVDVISLRFDLIKESLRADMFKSKYRALDEGYKIDLSSLDEGYEKIAKELDEDLEFIKWANLSSTTLNESDIKRVQEIAKKSFMIGGKSVKLLMEDEVEALSVRYGTLTKSERDKINEHALITLNMLKMITFPKKYSKVPSIAGAHHEKLNGDGYPQGLKEDEISFEAQLLAIVDILEALTSMDRPYKRAKTKEETYAILDEMVEKGEINKEIVSFIKEVNIFDKYINKELKEKEVLV
jgi:HD-GYP domain-containing protein (c-di-GMP phosphodiesterase class II)